MQQYVIVCTAPHNLYIMILHTVVLCLLHDSNLHCLRHFSHFSVWELPLAFETCVYGCSIHLIVGMSRASVEVRSQMPFLPTPHRPLLLSCWGPESA